MNLLVLNGSVRGGQGDCGAVLDRLARHQGAAELRRVDLASFSGTVEEVVDGLRWADAFFLATGTYWGSWGSPLQRLLEVVTPLEATEVFVGKPAACVVTMDSVGGVEVGTRLLGVFAMLGCVVPPFPLVVLSRTGAAVQGQPGFEDVWQEKDLEVTLHNLSAAVASDRSRFRAWPVEKGRLATGRWPSTGTLDLGLPSLDRRTSQDPPDGATATGRTASSPWPPR